MLLLVESVVVLPQNGDLLEKLFVFERKMVGAIAQIGYFLTSRLICRQFGFLRVNLLELLSLGQQLLSEILVLFYSRYRVFVLPPEPLLRLSKLVV